MKKDTLTLEKAKKSPAGGVLVGKREGQTMIYDDATVGGYFVGKLHKEGGIKGINKSTGQPIEVQGGEVIITAPAVADQTKREFEGEMLTNREILSKINEKGGGVSLENGGEIYYTGSSYNYGGKTMTDYEIMQSMNDCGCEHEYNDGGGVENWKKIKWLKNIGDEGWSATMEGKNAYENVGGYVSESGSWKIYRAGRWYYNKYDDFEDFIRDGYWLVYYKDELYGEFDTLKEAKEYVRNWIMVNPQNFATGGLFKGKSVEEIADMHNVSLQSIKKELAKGIEVESEHTSDKKLAEKIAKDHLAENPKYYTILDKVGLNDGGEVEKALNDLEKAPSVNFWNEPEFQGESYFFDKEGEPNSFVSLQEDDISKTILAYDEDGQLVGVFRIRTSGDLKGAFKIVVREDAMRKGWGKKLLDEAEKQNIDIVGNVKNNSFSSRGRDLLRSWLNEKSKKYKKGGELNLVEESKKGDHPSRDLNNYNDLMDVEADGMVGAESGLYAGGGGIKSSIEQPSVVTTTEDSWKVSRYRDGKEIYKKIDEKYSYEILKNKRGEVSLTVIVLSSIHGESFNRTYSDVITEYFDSVEKAKKYVEENYEKMNLTTNKNEAQSFSAEVFEWDKVPTNYRNISKVKKVPFTNNPIDKGLDSIISPFLGKDELRPVGMGINFDKNGITATDFHKLITLPYPNEKYEGIYDINRVKKIKADQPILIDGNYPNYEAIIPKSNIISGYEVDVYKLLQYTKTAINYANKITRGISFKFGDNERIGFNGSLLLEVLTASLKLGHEKLYAKITAPNRAMVLSPNKNYEVGNDDILLIMPIMLTSTFGTSTGYKADYGAEDIDYKRSLKAYYDFNDNEIHNADGSVAQFKMQYENNLKVDDSYLGLLNKMTSKKVYLPILQYVKVENGKMTATDLDISLIVKDVNMPNGIYEIVNKAPNITMNPIEDFPSERVFDKSEYETHWKEKRQTAFQFITFSEVFEFYLDKLLLSVGKDDLRPVMSGICIKKTAQNEMFLVTTNAHTLCKINITEYCEFNKDDRELEYILPVKYLNDFVKLADGSLHFKCSLSNIFIEAENLDFIGKTIDGKYPNYDAVIPRDNSKKIVFDHVAMNKCLKSPEMANLTSKYKGQKDILFDFFNVGNTLNIKVSEKKGYNVQSDLIETIELCKIDLNYKEVENTLSLDQSVFLLMPSKDEFKENQYFSFRKEFFDVMLETITDTEVECYFSEPNRAYIFPIDAIDYKKTLPVEKTKQQKLSKAEIKQIIELEEMKDVLEPMVEDKPIETSELQEAIETLEILFESSKGKDKKEIKEALEILKMLNEN